MKLHHLRDFLAIAHAGSIRAAARDLGLSQPGLTRSLGELEKELGIPLLERHARGVVLTTSGESFVLRARAATEEIRRAREEVAQQRGEKSGSVAIGMSSAVWLALAPGAVLAFRKDHPEVRLRLMEGFFFNLEQRLRDGTLDFYVGPLPERPLGNAYRTLPLFQNEPRIVGRRNHPRKAAKSLRELVGEEWIVTGVRESPEAEFAEVFTAHGLRPPVATIRADSLIGVAALISATNALAVLPSQWVSTPLFSNALEPIAVKERFAGPDIVQISRTALPLTPVAERLSVLLQREAAGQISRGKPNARRG